MQIKEILLDQIKPFEKNPRKNKQAIQQVAKSIEAHGFNQPLVLDQNMRICVGHTRYYAAKEIGIESVPCIIKEMTDAKFKAYNIADNKTHEFAEWDEELLKELFEDQDVFMDYHGFSQEELDRLLDPEVNEGLTDDDDVPEEAPIVAKLGDLFEIGNHRVLCGDSTDKEQVDRLMSGDKADMVFTDPPYKFETEGGGIFSKSKKLKEIKRMGINKFSPTSLIANMGKTQVYFCNKTLIPEYIELAKEWKVSWDIAVNHKKNASPNWSGHMQSDLEYIMILGHQGPKKGLSKGLYSKLYSSVRKDKEIDYPGGWFKPVELCIKFISLYSDNTIYDPFLGSGSTLIACEKTNRKCYGMELDPHYVDVIVQRWVDFTGITSIKKNGEPIDWPTSSKK